jgi:hypothetical protein
MNKQEALTKIAALEAETKALRAIIEAPDKPAVPTRWKPQKGEEYFQVSAYRGEVGEVRAYTSVSQDECNLGNCFKTRNHAEIAARAVSQTLKICAAAFAVDPDAGEWIEGERHWAVYKGSGGWHVAAHWADVNPVHVHTQEQARQAAAILNAEGV